MRRLIALVATLAITEPARADWVELGVAAQCNQDGMTFHVLPIVTTNIVAHNIRVPSGAHVFLSGSDQIYRCKLGRSSIELRLDVSPPQERGMGQGTGTVTISGLTVNGNSIIPSLTNFNWQASPAEPVLTRIVLARQASGLTSTLCYSRGWDWEHPYTGERCKETRWSADD